MECNVNAADFSACLRRTLGPRVADHFARADRLIRDRKLDCDANTLAAHQEVTVQIAKAYAARAQRRPGYKKGDRRGMLVWHSTGSGKTAVAAGIALAFLQPDPEQQAYQDIYLVTTANNHVINTPHVYAKLMTRFYPDEVARVLPGVTGARQRMDALVRMLGGNPGSPGDKTYAKGPQDRIKRTSYIMLNNQMFDHNLSKKTFTGVDGPVKRGLVLVLDEVQNLFAEQRAEKLRAWLTDKAATYRDKPVLVFALSATPARSLAEWADVLNVVRPVCAPRFKGGAVDDASLRGLVSFVDLAGDRSRVAEVERFTVHAKMEGRYWVAYAFAYGKHLKSVKAYDPKRPLAYLQTQRRMGDYLLPAEYAPANKTPFIDAKDPRYTRFDTPAGPLNRVLELKQPQGRRARVVASHKLAIVASRVATRAGKHFVYTQFAAELLVDLLRQLGLKHLGEDVPVATQETDHAERVRKLLEYIKERKVRCVATLDGAARTLLVDAFNHPDNRDGQYIKAIVATGENYEGLDLTALRFVHLVEPMFNQTSLAQAIGRGARSCSHRNLRAENRVVRVMQYISVPPPVTAAAVQHFFKNADVSEWRRVMGAFEKNKQTHGLPDLGGDAFALVRAKSHGEERELMAFENRLRRLSVDGPLFHARLHAKLYSGLGNAPKLNAARPSPFASARSGNGGNNARNSGNNARNSGNNARTPNLANRPSARPRNSESKRNTGFNRTRHVRVPLGTFDVVDVAGDGNCMFTAAVVAARGGGAVTDRDVQAAAELRREVAQREKADHTDWYPPYDLRYSDPKNSDPEERRQWDDSVTQRQRQQIWAHEMSKPYVYADQPELPHIARIIRRTVHIYTLEGNQYLRNIVEYEPGANNTGAPPISLLYNGKNHYKALIPKRTNAGNIPKRTNAGNSVAATPAGPIVNRRPEVSKPQQTPTNSVKAPTNSVKTPNGAGRAAHGAYGAPRETNLAGWCEVPLPRAKGDFFAAAAVAMWHEGSNHTALRYPGLAARALRKRLVEFLRAHPSELPSRVPDPDAPHSKLIGRDAYLDKIAEGKRATANEPKYLSDMTGATVKVFAESRGTLKQYKCYSPSLLRKMGQWVGLGETIRLVALSEDRWRPLVPCEHANAPALASHNNFANKLPAAPNAPQPNRGTHGTGTGNGNGARGNSGPGGNGARGNSGGTRPGGNGNGTRGTRPGGNGTGNGNGNVRGNGTRAGNAHGTNAQSANAQANARTWTNANVAALREAHRQEMAAMREAHTRTVTALREELRERTAGQNAASRAQLIEQYERNRNALEKRYQDELGEERAAHQRALAEARARQNAQNTTTRGALNAQKAEYNQRLAAAAQAAEEKHERNLAELEAKLRAEHGQNRARAEQNRKKEREDIEPQINRANRQTVDALLKRAKAANLGNLAQRLRARRNALELNALHAAGNNPNALERLLHAKSLNVRKKALDRLREVNRAERKAELQAALNELRETLLARGSNSALHNKIKNLTEQLARQIANEKKRAEETAQQEEAMRQRVAELEQLLKNAHSSAADTNGIRNELARVRDALRAAEQQQQQTAEALRTLELEKAELQAQRSAAIREAEASRELLAARNAANLDRTVKAYPELATASAPGHRLMMFKRAFFAARDATRAAKASGNNASGERAWAAVLQGYAAVAHVEPYYADAGKREMNHLAAELVQLADTHKKLSKMVSELPEHARNAVRDDVDAAIRRIDAQDAFDRASEAIRGYYTTPSGAQAGVIKRALEKALHAANAANTRAYRNQLYTQVESLRNYAVVRDRLLRMFHPSSTQSGTQGRDVTGKRTAANANANAANARAKRRTAAYPQFELAPPPPSAQTASGINWAQVRQNVGKPTNRRHAGQPGRSAPSAEGSNNLSAVKAANGGPTPRNTNAGNSVAATPVGPIAADNRGPETSSRGNQNGAQNRAAKRKLEALEAKNRVGQKRPRRTNTRANLAKAVKTPLPFSKANENAIKALKMDGRGLRALARELGLPQAKRAELLETILRRVRTNTLMMQKTRNFLQGAKQANASAKQANGKEKRPRAPPKRYEPY